MVGRQSASRRLAPSQSRLSRRIVLQAGIASAGAFLLTARLLPVETLAADTATPSSPFALTPWIRIAADNSVTLIASQSEMGQGTSTTLAAALADELDLHWGDIKIEFAPFAEAYRDPVYKFMFTGNSQSISSFYELMRHMGAASREMLVSAAAARLGVPADALTTRAGVIHHAGSGRSLTFGDLASEAAKLPVPENPRLSVKQSLIGHAQPRWDIPLKVDGSAVFGIDVKVPNMRLAAVRCAPRFGARLLTYDEAAIKAKPGVVAVVEISNGLAVVADTYWHARRALDAAELQWSDEGSTLTNTTGLPAAYYEKLEAGPFFTRKKLGDAPAALGAAPRKLDAVYEVPFQAHATMEPMNCTASVTADGCEIWAPTQGVELSQYVANQVTGLPLDRIVIHRTFLGGGFGRRLLADFVKQTLIVAMAVKQPVKLIWSREEDLTRDAYRPAMLHRISAGLDNDGALRALAHRVVSPSYFLYVFPRSALPPIKDWTDAVAPPEPYDEMAVEGLVDPPYALPNLLVEQHRLELDIPVSVWRSTGHGPNNFVLESFIDELADAAKKDPLAFRRSLLANNPRALKLLELVAAKAHWGTKLPANSGRGIALASAFGGLVAEVVELSIVGAKIKVHKIIVAVDCGKTLDPGIAASNIAGGVVWGLSGMQTAITFDRGRAQQSNFDGFTPLHLWETPPVEVHFLDSGEKPGGTGELGPVPVHAALCNAIFAATGKRIRSLPLSNSGLTFA